jgi:hypoxanthine phosphoribosyltransferase
MMARLEVLLTRRQIESAVEMLATDIASVYQDKSPLLLGILKGSFIFIADLARRLDFPLEVDFVTLSSYDERTESCGEVSMSGRFAGNLRERHVLVVEDIVDTGLSLHFLLDHIREEKPASLRLCALLDKPSRRKLPVQIDYLGFTIPDRFVVGYGLDYAERYRNLPDICYIDDWD